MSDLPTGTVTFLFTDIEGSTRLWAEHGEAMGRSVARHDDLILAAIDDHGGYVFSTAGDSFAAAFSTAQEAVAVAVQVQLAIAMERWGETPIRVRMGIHAGEAEERADDYFGPVVNESARLMAAAHGGQILASMDASGVAGGVLPDGVGCLELGDVRLRDVDHRIGVVQLTHPDLEVIFPPLRGLAETPHNLPSQLTSFVGRERELEEVGDLVGDSRLVTLTGAGGSGKTRLALRFAAEVLDTYPDGVWFVDLAVVDDQGLVPGVVALTVGVAEAPGRSIVDRLVERLEARETLLILDNCEHVLDEAALLAVDILKRAAAVQIVATSRQPLGVAGERRYLVPTLEAPDDPITDPVALGRYPAVIFFTDRAESVQPGFRITSENASAVAQICQRLDGLPLALELAAARLNVLDPADLQRRLDDRFAILADGSRDRLERQQTLVATLDWSYQLLPSEEQILLNRLSVFSGGFTLDAAEQVCIGNGITPDRMLGLISGLVDQSLLVTSQAAAGRRFRFLETIGEYAAERLSDSHEESEFRQRHAELFRQLAVDWYQQAFGPDEVDRLDRLDEEWPNLRKSLQWHLDTGQIRQGQKMAGSLRSFYWRRYHATEGVDWLHRFVTADPAPTSERALALQALAVVSDEDEDYALWDQTIKLHRNVGSKRELAGALNNAGMRALLRYELETARERFEEGVQLARELDDPALLATLLDSYAHLIHAADNDLAKTLALHEEALVYARQVGSPEQIAEVLTMIGFKRRLAGDLDRSASALHEAQHLEKELGAKHGNAGWTQMGLAAVALDQNNVQAAVTHLLDFNDVMRPLAEDEREAWDAAAKPLWEWARIAAARDEHEVAITLLAAQEADIAKPETWPGFHEWHIEVEQTVNVSMDQLEPDRFEAAWNGGLQMTSTEALEYAVDTLTTGSA